MAFCRFVLFVTGVRGVRGKRLFLISSMFASTVPRTDLMRCNVNCFKARVARLNEALKLADSFSSMEFPMLMHGIIWSDHTETICEQAIEAAKVNDTQRLRSLCETIVKEAPAMLRYGRTEEMVKDIIEQFTKYAQNPIAA